jgi:hypothetical protein
MFNNHDVKKMHKSPNCEGGICFAYYVLLLVHLTSNVFIIILFCFIYYH